MICLTKICGQNTRSKCHLDTKECIFDCDRRTQPDPTTAEMLLWLAQNKQFPTITKDGRIVFERYAVTDDLNKIALLRLNEAVRAAYAEARKEEVTE